jgi:hypothetical protein
VPQEKREHKEEENYSDGDPSPRIFPAKKQAAQRSAKALSTISQTSSLDLHL